MSRSLSVALLSHLTSPASPTGAEHSVALLAMGLRQRGHRVSLIAPAAGPLDESLRDAGVELFQESCRMCWMAYHEARAWPVAAAKWVRYAWPDPGAGRLSRRLREWKPDVVHVNALPHVRGAAAAARLGLPLLWHVREILPPGARRRWFAARLRRDAQGIVAVSEAVAGWLRDEGLGDRLRVIPNGVRIPEEIPEAGAARRALGIPEEGCVAGLFGQLRPHKGAREFVQAGRLALASRPELRFVLAGAGPAAFVDSIRRDIDGNDRFHLLPPQDGADCLLSAADIVCLTTLTPDPLPRTVLEAMAWGRPVAAFRSGGTSEMVEHDRTGLLTAPGDVQGLAAALTRLAGDPELRRRMGEEGRARAQRSFSLSHHLNRMEEALQATVSGE